MLNSTLRGLGRSAYRAGKMAHQSIGYAREYLGRDLTEPERRTVMSGWRDERSDVCEVLS